MINTIGIFNYELQDVGKRPDNREQGYHIDLAWMICHVLKLRNIPMWVGFNALLHTDNLPEQVNLYMNFFNLPITSLDVIQETLVTTQSCAKEVGQRYGIVTYDLNAAKPAMQMQITDAPKYDDLFTMPELFHIELAFFKAIGKIVEKSGGPEMLTDSGALAPGSSNGFLQGKHFNRCRRLHPILALALEILHFQAFMKTCKQSNDFSYSELAVVLCNLQYDTDSTTWRSSPVV